MRGDLRRAIRFLTAKPGWTMAAVVSLALGIGANTVVFSVVDAVLLQPLPYRDPGRLVFMWRGQNAAGGPGLSGGDIADWRDQAPALDGAAPFLQGATVAIGTDGSDLAVVSYVGHDVFDVLGVAPVRGRPLRPDDDRDGAPHVVVVSHGFWQSRLGGDPGAIGRTIRMGRDVREVVGIMPPGFFFPSHDVQLWANLSEVGARLALRDDIFFWVVGRLAPGASIDRARVEIGAINARLDAEFSGARDTGIFPLRDVVLGDYRLALWTLLGAVGVLLVIACANVANLLLGRGIDREKELAVRSAMGASRLVLARQLTAESLLLALTAGVVGAFVSYPGIRAIRDLGLIDIPRIEGASLDLRVLLFTLGVSVVTGLVAGVLPALRGSRVDLAASLKGGGQAAASVDRRTLRELLLVGEVALALVLIIAAGLLVRSFVALRTFDWGFDPEGAVAISVRFPESLRAASIGQKVDFVDRALTGLARVPGVRSASVGRIAPLAGYSYGRGYTLAIDGQLAGQASVFEITHGYFDTLGTRILEGREFQHDQRNGVPEVVLGAGLASRLFPDGAVGRTLELVVLRADVSAALGALPDEEARQAEADPANWEYRQHTVVGVVQDVRMFNWDIEGSAVYTDVRRDTLLRDSPMEGMWTPNQFVLRTDADLDAVVGPARAALLEAEPGLTFDRVASLEDAAARAIGGAGSNRLLLLVSIAFGTLSLALAAIGIYGVMAHMVSRRTYEIGVRMALGADRASVVRLVLRRSLRLTALGLALGFTAAWAVTRVLASLLFGVSPTDPATLGSLAIVLLVVAAAASAVPAWRASRVDPLVATRAD